MIRFLLPMMILLPFSALSQKYMEDQKKIQFSLDSAGYVLNSPKVPENFTLFYNCDSVAFMKRVNGDTIEIYQKSGYAPLNYSSNYNTSSFIYYLHHQDEMKGSYFSKFYEDGRIIKQGLSNQTYIFRNDSLYEYCIDDGAYTETMLQLAFAHAFGNMDSLTMEKEIEEARQRYSPIERVDFIFHKDMFANADSVIIDSIFNSNNNLVILEKKWIENNKTCYRLKMSEPGRKSNYGYFLSFNEEMKFMEFEGCDKSKPISK